MIFRLGELVMLHRQCQEDSETESSTTGSQTPDLDISNQAPSMSSVYSDKSYSKGESPTESGSTERKSSFHLPFRKGSAKSSSNASDQEKKKEDGLVRWLRHGTVIYKSVGLGLMDLVVGMRLVEIAKQKQIGTQIEDF